MKYHFKKKHSFMKIYSTEIKTIAGLAIIPAGFLMYKFPTMWDAVFSVLKELCLGLCAITVSLVVIGLVSEEFCKRRLAYLPISLDEMKNNNIENLYDYIAFLSEFLQPKFNFHCGPIQIPNIILDEIVDSFKLYTDFESKKVRLDIKIYNTMNTSFVNITENYQFCIYYGEGQSGLETHKDLLESLNMEDLLTLGVIIPKEKFEFYRDLPL